MIAIMALQPAIAQTGKPDKKEARLAEVKNLLESKKFLFNARFMYPLGGGQRYLDAYYDLKVGQDSVVSFLPYFGVAYSNAGYNSNEDNGVKFTSTKFTYESTTNSKGMRTITIKPQDVRWTNRLILSVSPNGNAGLVVISNNRQQIRYDGFISEVPTKK